jgi:hypothetical protein|tara:strand:- start:113 stop:460 length:348 start_codon:yes stop_codon:yes gene_type:complete
VKLIVEISVDCCKIGTMNNKNTNIKEVKIMNNSKKFAEICGWIGAVLIHSATVPTSLAVIFGANPNLPELSLVLLVWSGLILFLIRAISQKDMLYIVSNLVGFILNSILLLIIVL